MTFGLTGFIFLFGSAQVSADVVNTNDSKATIEFTPGTGAPEVVDPIDPTEPLDPIDPENPPTGNEGPLTLDYISNLAFGEHEVDSKTVVYLSETLKPFVQVTDRRGTGAGWNLTASISDFTDGAKGTLPGTKLSLSNGEAVSASVLTEPTSHGVELLTGGDAVNVVTAEEDAGLGTWVNRWLPTEEDAELNDNVTLEVPAGAATVGEHTATLTWTLTDAPGQ